MDRVRALYAAIGTDVFQSATIDALFNSGVSGRLSPIGTAKGLTEVKSLFYWDGVVPPGYQTTINFVSLVPKNDRVWVEVDIQTQTVTPGGPQRKLRQVGSFRFNTSDQVIGFDLTMPYFGKAQAAFGIDATNPAVLNALEQQACQRYMTYCGPDYDLNLLRKCYRLHGFLDDQPCRLIRRGEREFSCMPSGSLIEPSFDPSTRVRCGRADGWG